MRDTDCPPFLEVLSCLLSIILSLAMIGYLLRWFAVWNVQVIPFGVWVFFLLFCFSIGYCFARLIKGLFPAWWRPGPGDLLVVTVLEIDLAGE